MTYNQIKTRLAPCVLHCEKCFAFANGDIANQSGYLKYLLGNFDNYAERFVDLLDNAVFSNYPQFKVMLNSFSESECKGCREESCKLFKSCKVRKCHEKKNVDYCFQCFEFPCSNTGFDENLYKRSVDINFKMKEIGVKVYYNQIKYLPRY